MRRKLRWCDDETIHTLGLLVAILYGILSGLASCTMDSVTGGEMPVYQDGKVLDIGSPPTRSRYSAYSIMLSFGRTCCSESAVRGKIA